MEKCTNCKEFLFSRGIGHRCAPEFHALDYDWNGDDWGGAQKIHAHDAESAAEKFAELADGHGDGPSERTVHIKDAGGKITSWGISFDYSIDYSAREIEGKTP